MGNTSPYRDKRQELFSQCFERGQSYEDYLISSDSNHAERWRKNEENIQVPQSQIALLSSFKRTMNVLVLSGIWCGDCSRQGPMLREIEKVCPTLRIRFLDNKANPDLADELRINGAEKVPVVVALSEDFFELARFGDRHLSVYRRKFQTELGAACDAGIVSPIQSELTEELLEWVAFFERVQLILRLAPMLRRRYND